MMLNVKTVSMYSCLCNCVAVREKEKKMILMRGLPGSGKSTLARYF